MFPVPPVEGAHETLARQLEHEFTRLGRFLVIAYMGIPIVPVFLNAYHPSLPTGQRCYELGVAIRQIADARPEKVVLLGSDGLSHDPDGSHTSWIDRDLDTWTLPKISEGSGAELAKCSPSTRHISPWRR